MIFLIGIVKAADFFFLAKQHLRDMGWPQFTAPGGITMVTLRNFCSKYGEDVVIMSSVIIAGLVLYLLV
jgi:hypothetical protein